MWQGAQEHFFPVCCKNSILKDTKHKSLHLAQKYTHVFVLISIFLLNDKCIYCVRARSLLAFWLISATLFKFVQVG